MPFADDSRAELRRSPLTIILTALGVIIAAAALVVSWWSRPAAHPALAGSRAAGIASASSVSLPNLAAFAAFMLASSLAGASLVRLLARRHPLPAIILSAPLASSAAFGGVLVFQLAPPRPITAAAMEAAGQTAFWTTLIIFAAVNGLHFAAGLMAPLRKSSRARRTRTAEATRRTHSSPSAAWPSRP